MTWKKEPPYEGPIHQGSLRARRVEKIAPMDMVVGVGFGLAQITRDDEIIFSESMDDERHYLLAEFETMAQKNPNHDWRCVIEGPLRGMTYQRQRKNKWVLIDSNMGFA